MAAIFRLSILFLSTALFSCAAPDDTTSSASEPADSGWTSLFDGVSLANWSVTNFGGEGAVKAEQGWILLERGEDLTGITWTGPELPRSGYELELEAARLGGNDFFCGLTFPVGDGYATLILGGWGGTVVGLSSIDGRDASENETTRAVVFENGRWYAIRLRVSPTRIEAWIDGEGMVGVDTPGRVFSVRPEVRLSRPLGIASWRTRAGLRGIRFREIRFR